jgi:rubrerythrin
MKTSFSLDEILKMAEQLEKNGATFYRFAAKEISNPHISKLLRDLASWEEGHEKIFARMRATLKGKMQVRKASDPKDKSSLHLQMLFDGNLFDLKTDPIELIKDITTIDDVLQMAVKKEKDSVIFYLSLKNLLANRADRKIIDKIIEEEMDHITFLNKELTTLRHQLM